MIENLHAVYGSLAPARFSATLIHIAQRCPRNWFGRQIALLLRKIVMLSNPQALDTAVGAIRLRCYLHDNVSERKFLFLPWLYDQRERDLIAKQLPENGVFVDIGANAGIYTLWACQYLTGQGTVIAIEPNPTVFERLLFNLRINQGLKTEWPQVRTLAIAISDQDGEMDLYLDRSNLGGASLVSHKDGAARIQVSCRPLQQVLIESGVDRVDILKIDIEGAEDLALLPFYQSASASLWPRYLIIENSEHLWRGDLVSVLRQRGYAVVCRTRMNTVYRNAGN